MQAFHNDIKIKEKYLSRVEAHRKADEIVQGITWENGKGCAIGCTLHSYNPWDYETELGIPDWLARVEDKIFEGLSKEDAQSWPGRFLSAINPGADLEKSKAPFLIFVMESTLDKLDPDAKKATENIIRLYKNPDSTKEEFETARTAASKADAVIASVAAFAAYVINIQYYAAFTVEAAAGYGVYVPYHNASVTLADIKRNNYKKFADKLIEILESIK